jgi:CubicO group peptidase (beta-lactamase class C family)
MAKFSRRLLLVSFCTVLGCAQEIKPKVDECVGAYVRDHRFMGTILIAKGGKILVEKGYGMADLELDVPNTPQTKFRLGSITKQFTAAAILQLEEKGKLSVNDPISKYFPGSPASWKDITIHHLLTHTSGIPNYTDFPGFMANETRKPLTVLQLIGTFENKPLDFEPGSKWKYSNSAYELLGYVIEKQSGMSYEDYLQQNIFNRLDMESSGYDHAAPILKNRASGYAVKSGKFENAPFLDMSIPYSAGSLYSTVEDLYRWDRALNTEKVLSRKSLEKMYTPFKNDYAYGWDVKDTPRKQYSHGGGIFGFSTFIIRYPADDALVVVLSNIQGAPAGKIATELAAVMFDAK